jgi:hypothetical protein
MDIASAALPLESTAMLLLRLVSRLLNLDLNRSA